MFFLNFRPKINRIMNNLEFEESKEKIKLFFLLITTSEDEQAELVVSFNLLLSILKFYRLISF